MPNLTTRAPRRAPILLAATTLIAVAGLAGCGSESIAQTEGPSAISTRSVNAQLESDLKIVRQATSKYHSFARAQADDYTFLFMDMCMVDESPEREGGMGFHYVNTNLLGGSLPDITKPQALLYEPASNGSLKLVAVEYVVPVDQWTGSAPPRLLGQEMKANSFGLYALHVWLYKENPKGMFENWNPTVSCQYASPAIRGGEF